MSTPTSRDPGTPLATFGVLAGPEKGERLAIRLPVVSIGRGTQNEIVLSDDSVSAVHARLEYSAGSWQLTDLNSTNGTYVEGVRLAPEVPTPLIDAATVRFGGVRLEFHPEADANPDAARAEYVPPVEPTPIGARGGFRLPVWIVALALLIILLAILYFSGVFTGGEPAGSPAGTAIPGAALIGGP